MIRAIHIEDEPGNIALLQNLIKIHCHTRVVLEGSATNIKDAIRLIETKQPQLVYLDIELKSGNAFELLALLPGFSFQVIFITAFNEYAVKAFRLNAVDYLLKPISITELKEATEKAISKINSNAGNENISSLFRQLQLNLEATVRKIGVPVSDGILFINSEDIISSEAKGSYAVIYLIDGKTITVTKKLKDIEAMLPASGFVRVHNSWIINIKHLKKYYRGKNGYMEMEDGSTVPVSIRKKGLFLNLFNGLSE